MNVYYNYYLEMHLYQKKNTQGSLRIRRSGMWSRSSSRKLRMPRMHIHPIPVPFTGVSSYAAGVERTAGTDHQIEQLRRVTRSGPTRTMSVSGNGSGSGYPVSLPTHHQD